MSDKNLSAVLLCMENLQMKDTQVPFPGKGEVLLRMHSVGICGSDVHRWKHGGIGESIVVPMILGHEASGVVSALGEGVTTLKVGDRVAIEPAVPCRKCHFCKGGRYNLCPDVAFGGCLRRYHSHAADFCYKLPDHVSLEEGALLEPLSVAVHACRRVGVSVGSKVLVCGAGAIGLITMMAAKAMGADAVCITDLSESRLSIAKEMGADATVLVKTQDPQSLVRDIHDSLEGAPNITIECSGAESSMQLGIHATISGGVVGLVGLGSKTARTLPIVSAAMREVDIKGIFRYANDYPIALSLVASGRVNVKPLVTHRFKLEHSLQALETSSTMTGGAIKVIVQCADE